MSQFKVKTLLKVTPLQYFDDGTFTFKEKEVLCWFYNLKKYILPFHFGKIYDNKVFYMVDYDRDLIRYNPLTGEKKLIKAKVYDLYEIIKVNDMILLYTDLGFLNLDGEITGPMFDGVTYEVLTSSQDYVLSYRITESSFTTPDGKPRDRVDTVKFVISTFPDFVRVHSTGDIELPTILCPQRYGGTSKQHLDHCIRKELEGKKYINDRFKILKVDDLPDNVEAFQLDGEISIFEKKAPKQRKECCICFKKPESVGLFLPCEHKDFCFGCAKTLQTCPICRATILKVIEV